MNTFFGSINQSLWNWIVTATRTVREIHSATSTSKSQSAIHTKKVRRFYIYCLLLYCTNPSCRTPIHTLLADSVEVCGGSRKLLHILNRLGAVCSEDVHDRFVTRQAQLQQGKHVWDELSSEVFTLATVDNFDMLQSHAAVYCGDQQRSYHGTTIQIVQPNPRVNIIQPGLTPPSPMQISKANSATEESASTHTSTLTTVTALTLPTEKELYMAAQAPPYREGALYGCAGPPYREGALYGCAGPPYREGALYGCAGPPYREGALYGCAGPPYREGALYGCAGPPYREGALYGCAGPPYREGALYGCAGPPPTEKDLYTAAQAPPTEKELSTAAQAPPTEKELSTAAQAPPTEKELSTVMTAPLTYSTHCSPLSEDTIRMKRGCLCSQGSTTPVVTTMLSRHHLVSTSTPEPKSLVYTKRQVSTSPASSPHKLGKIGPKRRRTMEITNKVVHVEREHTALAKQHIQIPSFIKFDDFQEGNVEIARRKHLTSMTFAYMAQKHALRQSDTYKGQILKEFRDFLPTTNEVSTKSQDHSKTSYQQSNIHYMELVDENPDSDETMMHIAEQLLEELQSQDYVVLVGDGKTYEHLMNMHKATVWI